MRKRNSAGANKTSRKSESLINEGTYWRLSDPFTDEIAAWMSVSEQQDHALVSVVRLMAEANQATVYVPPAWVNSRMPCIWKNKAAGGLHKCRALMPCGNSASTVYQRI